MKTSLISLFLFVMVTLPLNAQRKLYITANGVTKTSTLFDNNAVTSLVSSLEKGPITLSFSEYGGFEKTADLPRRLPTSDRRMTAQPGDIMLYLGNVMCIFFGSNSWSYTPLGKLDDMTSSDIKKFLSGNPTRIILSLSPLD